MFRSKPPHVPVWVMELVGEDLFADVIGVGFYHPERVGDGQLEHLKGLTEVETVALAGTQVSDNGLENLTVLTELGYLNLIGTQVTSEGVETFQKAHPDCHVLWKKFPTNQNPNTP